MIKVSKSRRAFQVVNYTFLTLMMIICILPLWHILCISVSENRFAVSGQVSLWPRGFTLSAYSFLSAKSGFMSGLAVSVRRVLLGSVVNMALCILCAYPLSRENSEFRFRTVYVWFFAITMFFGGGMIPTYFVVSGMGLIDTMWALVLPGALNVSHCVMMLNFFRGIPKALDEAATLDGAGHVRKLFSIYIPLSTASFATILLFTIVNHWNSWFDGYIYINTPAKYPLQTYLKTVIDSATMVNKEFMSEEELIALANVNDKTLRMAQIFLGALPVMCVYPFLQKYFVKGITLGSVKG